jgi:rfaE bifunctional protein kinase chain/domain
MADNITIQLPDFRNMHMVVIGDVMIDRYISGVVRRVSPEAPVPVVEMSSLTNSPGGAANVAINLIAMGARVTLLSAIGNDTEADVMELLLEKYPGLTVIFKRMEGRKTTVKTRIMSGSQHLLRIDSEDTDDIYQVEAVWILEQLKKLIETESVSGIILQDYNKGVMTAEVIQGILERANAGNIPSFVDPKAKNFFTYRGCTVFKPNKKEALEACRTEGNNLKAIDERLREALHHTLTVITLGSEGMYMNDGVTSGVFPTSQRDIADVCGAGDTVISVISLCYVAGMNMHEISRVANAAGGQVCEHPGVVAVDIRRLQSEIL